MMCYGQGSICERGRISNLGILKPRASLTNLIRAAELWGLNPKVSIFETADEYFDYYWDNHVFLELYGLDLPDEVLKKLYYDNALKIRPGLSHPFANLMENRRW